jgi:hypothetical protein
MVPSFERQIEILFEHWLANVERLLGRHVDHDAAYKAWRDGYSIREFVAEVSSHDTPHLAPR